MLIKTVDGSYIPESNVSVITFPGDGEGRLLTRDGVTFRVRREALPLSTMINSNPNLVVIEPIVDDEGVVVDVQEYPVLAWTTPDLRPVTVLGVQAGYDAVLDRATGWYMTASGVSTNSRQDLLACLNEGRLPGEGATPVLQPDDDGNSDATG